MGQRTEFHVGVDSWMELEKLERQTGGSESEQSIFERTTRTGGFLAHFSRLDRSNRYNAMVSSKSIQGRALRAEFSQILHRIEMHGLELRE